MKAISLFLCILFIVSCKKQGDPIFGNDHRLAVLQGFRTVSIGQQILLYDSTALKDSFTYNIPPRNRLYVWAVKPDDKSVSFSGEYQYGKGSLLFNHAGSYSISATILDSATHRRVGGTESLTVTVLTDTLPSVLTIDPRDSLSISTLGTGTADKRYLLFWLVGAKSYPYPNMGFDCEVTDTLGQLSIVFSDTIRLITYPVVAGYGNTHAYGNAAFEITSAGTRPLSITWLDKTYSGTLNIDSTGRYHIGWVNGVVSFH